MGKRHQPKAEIKYAQQPQKQRTSRRGILDSRTIYYTIVILPEHLFTSSSCLNIKIATYARRGIHGTSGSCKERSACALKFDIGDRQDPGEPRNAGEDETIQ